MKTLKAAGKKCLRGFVRGVGSVFVMPEDNRIDTGYLKNYFFQTIGKAYFFIGVKCCT